MEEILADGEALGDVLHEITTAAYDAGMDTGVDLCLALFTAMLNEDQRVPREAADHMVEMIRKEFRRDQK